MKTFTKILFFTILISLLTSCKPHSKEAYLKQYNEFIDNVSKNGSKFSENDWEKKDAEFKNYNEVWYAHFQDQLTWQEKAITAKNSVQFTFYRNQSGMESFFKTYLQGDYDSLKKRIEDLYGIVSLESMSLE